MLQPLQIVPLLHLADDPSGAVTALGSPALPLSALQQECPVIYTCFNGCQEAQQAVFLFSCLSSLTCRANYDAQLTEPNPITCTPQLPCVLQTLRVGGLTGPTSHPCLALHNGPLFTGLIQGGLLCLSFCLLHPSRVATLGTPGREACSLSHVGLETAMGHASA